MNEGVNQYLQYKEKFDQKFNDLSKTKDSLIKQRDERLALQNQLTAMRGAENNPKYLETQQRLAQLADPTADLKKINNQLLTIQKYRQASQKLGNPSVETLTGNTANVDTLTGGTTTPAPAPTGASADVGALGDTATTSTDTGTTTGATGDQTTDGINKQLEYAPDTHTAKTNEIFKGLSNTLDEIFGKYAGSMSEVEKDLLGKLNAQKNTIESQYGPEGEQTKRLQDFYAAMGQNLAQRQAGEQAYVQGVVSKGDLSESLASAGINELQKRQNEEALKIQQQEVADYNNLYKTYNDYVTQFISNYKGVKDDYYKSVLEKLLGYKSSLATQIAEAQKKILDDNATFAKQQALIAQQNAANTSSVTNPDGTTDSSGEDANYYRYVEEKLLKNGVTVNDPTVVSTAVDLLKQGKTTDAETYINNQLPALLSQQSTSSSGGYSTSTGGGSSF